MTDIAIRVEKLSKKYTIKIGKTRHDTLSERLVHGWKELINHPHGLRSEDIWPLNDVSFEVKRGEVVGIIGRNGAGKSTLLKILSRITEPTKGRAQIYGRIGSLLEVGTGFHPDLTGRENIYLSGAILGMKRTEIDRRFDEIVAFADIEKFIDTPVKRYSSGMYVRLAFAVGAHLEPEILMVDEVLAVGDSQFQKKCLNKMHAAGEQGRTVLFVSHNLQAITRLCHRVILLDNGKVLEDGPAQQVVGAYLHSGFYVLGCREWPELVEAPGDDIARLRAVRVRTVNGRIGDVIDIRESFAIEIELDVLVPGYMLLPHFVLVNEEGESLFEAFDLDADWRGRPRPTGRYMCNAWIPGNLLAEGTFFVSPACISLAPHKTQFWEHEVIAFQVFDSLNGDSARGEFTGEMLGVVRPMLKWTTRFVPSMTAVDVTGVAEDSIP